MLAMTLLVRGEPIISEFLASNSSELADEDGEFSDWIEIHNPDAVAVNMAGWHLTDSSTNLDKWTFPSVSIPADGYLVVFASDKDRATAGSELHTDFKLSSSGEYLALVKSDGVTKISEFNPYPGQNEDVSYGTNSSNVLLGQNAALRYTLTTPGGTWKEHNFDDSSWDGHRSSDVGVVITECETGSPDEVELQNVSGATVDTTGWYMAFGEGANGNINGVEEFLAFLPSSMASGGLHLFTENTGALGNIGWSNSGLRGWAMLFNASDEVMDFVVWGYSEAEVRSLNINQSISGKQVTFSYTDVPWSGAAEGSGSNFSNNIVRSGSRDTDTAADWSFTSSATLGSQNSSISRPFTSYGQTQSQAGIGFEDNSGYESLLLTNIDSDSPEVWVRFPFTLANPADVNALTLRLRYDDGFQAFINGVAVANANDTSTVGLESGDFVDFNLNVHLSSLRTGQNVLAVRLINESSASSDFLLMPELVASLSSSLPSYTYLTDPSPGVANQGGVLNPGPVISEVTENPTPPTDAQSLVVTANVQPRDTAVSTVMLRYRVDYGSEVNLVMLDDGSGGDVVSGDGVFSATIPASASSAGDMLRWAVVATDAGGEESQMPLLADTTGTSQSPEYYGTVISSVISGSLPVMQWFTQDESASRTRTGTRASVFYDGKFYDNIFVRQRGGFTNGGSQKFDFNKGFPLFVNADLPSVGEINMNGNGFDDSYVRQPLAFNYHTLVGTPSCEAFPIQMRLNGSFDRVGLIIEQVDEDYLSRFGYDGEDGELFKFTQRSGSNSTPVLSDVDNAAEKKTGDENNFSSLQNLVNNLIQNSSTARIDSFYDDMDVPQFLNYMAARTVLQMADDARKNFYLYKDTAGDGRWRIFPWDLDFTFGVVGGVGEARAEHPFFATSQYPTSDGQWNRLFDVAFEDVQMQRLHLRRVRTLMDAHMKATSTGSWFELRTDEIFTSMASLSGPSQSAYTTLRNTEIPERRVELFNQYTTAIPGYSVVIPTIQSSLPGVVIDQVDFNPVGGDQDQEYIRLTNNENTEIDISGWSLSVGVSFTFPQGSVIPRNGTFYVSPKLEKFLTRSISPTAGERRLLTGPYSGHLSSFGEDLVLSNETGIVIDTFNYMGTPSDAQQYLVISEFLYHPLGNSAAEFVEITNISNTITVDLTGVHFSNGISFSFTGAAITSLAPGERVLVVKDQVVFESAYGTSATARIAGVFADGTELNNGGEGIKLDDASNSTIHEFTFLSSSPWPVTAGSSLILLNPDFLPDHDDPANWMASDSVGGSPANTGLLFDAWLSARGQTDPLAVVDGWSELLTYTLGRDLAGSSFIYSTTVEDFDVESIETPFLTLTTTIRDSSDTQPVPQISTNLVDWVDATTGIDILLVSDTDNGNGTRTLKWRSLTPVSTGNKRFLRFRVLAP
jgi:hypothetical protein